MSIISSHDPFGHLKHKLWPKEGSRVKLTIWFLTIKSQESFRFPCVQVVCNIPLESSWRGLQLFFKPHPNQRSAREVMGLQSRGSPSYENFGFFHLWVPRRNDIWVLVLWLVTEYTIRGKMLASPKFGPWWVLWVRVCPWFVLAPKVFQLCINQCVIWFVQVHVSEWLLVIFPSPILEFQHAPLPHKCYKPRSVP